MRKIPRYSSPPSSVILRGKILWPKMRAWKKNDYYEVCDADLSLMRNFTFTRAIIQHFIKCIANGECPMKKKVAPGIDRLFQLPHKQVFAFVFSLSLKLIFVFVHFLSEKIILKPF